MGKPFRVVNICLSDIPADKRFKSEKTGKIYASFTIFDNDQPDKFGNDCAVSMSKDKDAQNEKTVYVGNGKIKGGQPAQQAPTQNSSSGRSDLGF